MPVRTFFTPSPKGRDPGAMGTVRLVVALALLVPALLVWFAPLLLLAPEGAGLLERVVFAATHAPVAVMAGVLLYLGAGALGAEHPWRPLRFLANLLMGIGFYPMLILVLISFLWKAIWEGPSGKGDDAAEDVPEGSETPASPSREGLLYGIG